MLIIAISMATFDYIPIGGVEGVVRPSDLQSIQAEATGGPLSCGEYKLTAFCLQIYQQSDSLVSNGGLGQGAPGVLSICCVVLSSLTICRLYAFTQPCINRRFKRAPRWRQGSLDASVLSIRALQLHYHSWPLYWGLF